MKIRITRATADGMSHEPPEPWYSGHIGSEFFVKYERNGCYYVDFGDEILPIRKKDAKVVRG